MKKSLTMLLIALLALSGCKSESSSPAAEVAIKESAEAKALLQGVWLDSETEMVAFRAEGDTIYYPDATNQPAYFRIVRDSLQLGSHRYLITKQSKHQFYFQNQTGDIVRLVKSEDPDLDYAFEQQEPKILTVTEVVKTDSVVYYEGERYHWYIAVNPTKYKVVTTSYNSEGVGVENVYYDNIIHISLFQGARQLFSRDFNKKAFVADVPEAFLEQAILGNMRFNNVDAQGFHFSATICIPDGASCYMVETLVSFKGELSMKLLEY